MSLIEPKTTDLIDTGHDAPLCGIGEFDSHPGKICFLGQDPAGKRLGIFFTASHDRAAAICAALMEHSGIRQVSIRKDGSLSWQLRGQRRGAPWPEPVQRRGS